MTYINTNLLIYITILLGIGAVLSVVSIMQRHTERRELVKAKMLCRAMERDRDEVLAQLSRGFHKAMGR